MSIRSQISLIMDQVIPDQSVLSALEIEKLNFNSLFGIYPHCTALYSGERYRTIMVLLFSFPHNVFYLVEHRSLLLSYIFVCCLCMLSIMVSPKVLWFGYGLIQEKQCGKRKFLKHYVWQDEKCCMQEFVRRWIISVQH